MARAIIESVEPQPQPDPAPDNNNEEEEMPATVEVPGQWLMDLFLAMQNLINHFPKHLFDLSKNEEDEDS